MPSISLCLHAGLDNIPEGIALIEFSLDRYNDGDVVLDGVVGFADSGVFGPFETEYLLTDDGVIYWDNFIFRNVRGRVMVLKRGCGFQAAQNPYCENCFRTDCYFNPQYKEKHTDIRR